VLTICSGDCGIDLRSTSSRLHVVILFIIDIQRQRVTLLRSGGNSLSVNSQVQIFVANVRNDDVVGKTEKISVVIATQQGYEIDLVQIDGVHIASGNLTNSTVDLVDATAYSITKAQVCFVTRFVGLLPNSLVSIMFPSNHQISDDFSEIIFEGIIVSKPISLTGNTVHISVESFTRVCVTLKNIRNYHAGPTSYYQIVTLSITRRIILEQNCLLKQIL